MEAALSTTPSESGFEPSYIGHRKRLRERYTQGGLSALQDYELLELLLSFSIPHRDTKPYAKRVLAAFGTVRSALEADFNALLNEGGLPPQSALQLKAVGDLYRLSRKDLVRRGAVVGSPQDVAGYLREELGPRSREAFMALYLDNRNHLLECRMVQEGTVDQTAVYPREILKRALELNATGMILAHNHPGGFLGPSESDRALTRQIQSAAKAMGVTVHDHLILTAEGSFSFRQSGLL